MKGKDILFGLNDVGNDLIEMAEYGQFPAGKERSSKNETPRFKRIWKPLPVAAILTLMVLFMGCAVLLLHLEDLRIKEETYKDNMRYAEDGSKIPATKNVKQYISISGAEGSNNYLAAQEWMDFKQSYDPDGSLWRENAGFERGAQYKNYVDAYSQEMLDKIDDICRKYNLKLEGDAVIFQENVAELFGEVLGISGITRENSGLKTEFGGARVTECGNFNASYRATLETKEASQEFEFTLIYDYRDKDYFTSAYLTIEDGESVEQWNCTLPDGTNVLIVSDKGGDAFLLYNREDAFINVTIRNVGWNWDSPGDVMSHADLELIAQALDYTLKPNRVENMPQLQQELEEIYQTDVSQEEDPAEAEARMQLYEENEHHESYADLISQMRDNESYFVNHCNVAYEHFWDTMEYTLLDITGDGAEELILGRDGHIHEIWTIRDGVTQRVTSSYYEGYLCEGNVYESYIYLDGKPYHFYFQIGKDGLMEGLMTVEYDAAQEGWILDESQDGTGRTLISEERAMELINSFVRIPLQMKSVKEYLFA